MAQIIIVEDDLKIANVYKERLEQDGHSVEISEDIEAMTTIGRIKPDLVLLDILMPKISGLTILRELKIDEQLSEIPIIILTNVEGAGELAEAISLGASGYLVKSDTTMDLLSQKIKEVLASTSIASGVKTE